MPLCPIHSPSFVSRPFSCRVSSPYDLHTFPRGSAPLVTLLPRAWLKFQLLGQSTQESQCTMGSRQVSRGVCFGWVVANNTRAQAGPLGSRMGHQCDKDRFTTGNVLQIGLKLFIVFYQIWNMITIRASSHAFDSVEDSIWPLGCKH